MLCIYPDLFESCMIDELDDFDKKIIHHLQLNGRLANQELAELLGFYDTAHFNHTFKKFTGKTIVEAKRKFVCRF